MSVEAGLKHPENLRSEVKRSKGCMFMSKELEIPELDDRFKSEMLMVGRIWLKLPLLEFPA
jgi:hypothetical protein